MIVFMYLLALWLLYDLYGKKNHLKSGALTSLSEVHLSHDPPQDSHWSYRIEHR